MEYDCLIIWSRLLCCVLSQQLSCFQELSVSGWVWVAYWGFPAGLNLAAALYLGGWWWCVPFGECFLGLHSLLWKLRPWSRALLLSLLQFFGCSVSENNCLFMTELLWWEISYVWIFIRAAGKKKTSLQSWGQCSKISELNYRFPQIKCDVFLVSARTTDWFCQEIPMPNVFLVIRDLWPVLPSFLTPWFWTCLLYPSGAHSNCNCLICLSHLSPSLGFT